MIITTSSILMPTFQVNLVCYSPPQLGKIIHSSTTTGLPVTDDMTTKMLLVRS